MVNFRLTKKKVIASIFFAAILIIVIALIWGMILIGLSDATDVSFVGYLFSFIISLPMAIIAGAIIWIPVTLIFYVLFSLFQKTPETKGDMGNWRLTRGKTIVMLASFLIPFLSILFFYGSFGAPFSIGVLSISNAVIPGFISIGLIYFIWSLNQKKDTNVSKKWLIIFIIFIVIYTLTLIIFFSKSSSSICLIENPQDCDYSCNTDEDCKKELSLCLNKNQIVATQTHPEFDFFRGECGCVNNKCQEKL